MRLDEQERRVLIQEIQNLDPNAEIYLYGSRVDDNLKGGDIDLLILSTKIDFSTKISVLVDIKLILGDQKIDLLIKNPEAKSNDPFIISILENSIRLG